MADAVAARPVTATNVFLPNLDSIIRGLLYLYIFSLPFKNLLFIERNGFIILIVLLVLWCAANRRHFFLRTPIDLPLIAFVGWIAVTVPFATFPVYSFKELAKLLQQGLIFYVVVYFFQDPVHRRRLVWMLIGELALVSAYGIWQFDTKPWRGPFAAEGREYHLIESFLSGDVALTTYLVMLAPLGAAVALYRPERWKRVLAGGTTGLAILCQFLTFSRAGLLAMLVETVVFVWVVGQKKVAYWAGALILALVVGTASLLIVDRLVPGGLSFIPGPTKFTTYNLEARFNIWTFAFQKVAEHPLVGIGYGKDNFFKVTGQESEGLSSATKVMPAGTHNTFLDVVVGAGIPALAALLWLFWAILRAGFSKLGSGEEAVGRALPVALVMLVAGMVVRNFFDHMWIGTLAVQFWVLVALCVQVQSSPARSMAPGL